MANQFPIPPTYTEPVLRDERTGKSSFNPIWLSWFLNFAQLMQQAISGTSTNHENLTGLEGGTGSGASGEHYHFTAAEHALLQAYTHESLNGLLGGAAGDHYHFTGAEHTLLQAYNHEGLAGLSGGAVSDHYHLKQAEHDSLVNGPPTAVTSITVPASGTGWHNTTGFNVLVIPSGGTVSAYALSRDNVTYFPVGLPTIIPVVRGDYLKTTYTVVPTLNYFAM